MEPIEDRELSGMLREWKAPDAPATLRGRVLPRRPPWWQWLMTGSVRVPVPAAAAALLLLALWAYAGRSAVAPGTGSPPDPQREATVSLADFRPIAQVELRVVREVK